MASNLEWLRALSEELDLDINGDALTRVGQSQLLEALQLAYARGMEAAAKMLDEQKVSGGSGYAALVHAAIAIRAAAQRADGDGGGG